MKFYNFIQFFLRKKINQKKKLKNNKAKIYIKQLSKNPIFNLQTLFKFHNLVQFPRKQESLLIFSKISIKITILIKKLKQKSKNSIFNLQSLI